MPLAAVRLIVVNNAGAVQDQLKELFHGLFLENTSGLILIGISGGGMVSQLSELLCEIQFDSNQWNRLHFFYCDERLVPFHSEDSTHGAYDRAVFGELIVKQLLPRENVHCIDPSMPVQECALDYEEKVKRMFSSKMLEGAAFPSFDLLLLGMGPDGHTCSLFPDHKGLKECHRWVIPISDSPKPPPERITLTLNVVNSARTVCFITLGSSKFPALKRVLYENVIDESTPVSMVKPAKLLWMVDDAALPCKYRKCPQLEGAVQ